MGEGIGHTGQLFVDESANSCFIRRVNRRPQEADRHCLDLALAQGFQYLGRLTAIEWEQDLPFRIDALANLEGQSTRDIRFWIMGREVVWISLAAFTKH